MNILVKLLLVTFSFCVSAQVTPFYTTRLLSTSGAGVASILVNESSTLNPASIVFIPITNVYYQKTSGAIKTKASSRVKKSDSGIAQIYQVSDTSGALKGTLGFQMQARNGYERKKFVSSFASTVGKRTSMGLIYSYNFQSKPGESEEKFHQATLGLTYIHTRKLSFGFVLQDPFATIKAESIAKGGFQYALFNNIILIQDFEYSLKEQSEDEDREVTSRSAVQINFFKDFFIRAGMFKDTILKTKGNSYGLSWIGPKLSVDFAIMKSTFTEDTLVNFKDEVDTKSSFAVSVRY